MRLNLETSASSGFTGILRCFATQRRLSESASSSAWRLFLWDVDGLRGVGRRLART